MLTERTRHTWSSQLMMRGRSKSKREKNEEKGSWRSRKRREIKARREASRTGSKKRSREKM